MSIRLATYYHAKDVPDLPGSNIFHSTELFHVLEQTNGYCPRLLVAYEGETPIGKLLCILRRSTRLCRFVEKGYAYGVGEYFSSSYRKEEIFRELLSYFTLQFSERAFILEFRNLEEPLFGYRYFRQNGYFPVRWLRVRNSLHHDSLDKWMSASRKKQISHGLKNGAVIEVAHTKEELKAFFSMLKRYYSPKIHRYLPDIGFSVLCWNILPIVERFLSCVTRIRLLEGPYVCSRGVMPTFCFPEGCVKLILCSIQVCWLYGELFDMPVCMAAITLSSLMPVCLLRNTVTVILFCVSEESR